MATTTEPRHGLANYVHKFKGCSADEKLAILWRIYNHIGGERIENPDDNKESDSSLALYNKLKGKSNDEQLQFMRDVVSNNSNDLTNEYSQLSETTQVAIWYRLAQGMSGGDVVPMPEDFTLSGEAQEVADNISAISFEQCYVFMRDALLSN